MMDTGSPQEPAPDAQQNGTEAPQLSPEERAQLEEELRKTEEEIGTLRQVLQARVRHAHDLKRRLGVTPWTEVTHDFQEGLKAIKESTAYQKTNSAMSATSETMRNKMAALRSSNAYQAFQSKMGDAVTGVKSKLSSSTSMYGGLYGSGAGGTQPTDGFSPGEDAMNAARTQPTTPQGDRPKGVIN